MNYIDPDGKDYTVFFDHENKTVKVSAHYYTATDDLDSANEAVSFWNDQSGEFSYGDYTINFDLTIKEVQTSKNASITERNKALIDALEADQSGAANIFILDSNIQNKKNRNGITFGGNKIKVSPNKKDGDTGAHEVGHTLGMKHEANGIMTAESSDIGRSGYVSKRSIQSMINSALKGTINTEGDGKGNKSVTGKGTLLNTKDEIPRGKIQKNKN